MNKAIRLVVIEDKKLLLVRKRDSWILPGGKPNEDEGGLECLLREIKEELQAEAIIGNFYDSFTGTISHKKNPWTEVIYFGKIKGIIYPSTGIYDLNKWLFGGYEKDVVTMIAGPPGSGKTNFCILAACSQAKKGNKVIFIDTEGGFSVERVKQLLSDDKDDLYEKVLNNILLLSPSSFEEHQKSFQQLLKELKKQHVGLIVVDGMA